MPFYKKSYNKQQGVYYPRAVVQGKPVETETIAKDLAKISTVSNSDVQAVLGDIAGVMHTRMAQGKSVHIKGLGYFRYTLDTVGVEDLKDFDFEKQVKAVRVEFIPERTRLANGTYTRALVDSDQLEWIEFPSIIIENSTINAYRGDYNISNFSDWIGNLCDRYDTGTIGIQCGSGYVKDITVNKYMYDIKIDETIEKGAVNYDANGTATEN